MDRLNDKVERLESVFLNIIRLKPEERLIAPNISHLTDIKTALNDLFDQECTCKDVIYTLNTDKPFFGIEINPDMSPAEALIILTTDDKFKLKEYQLELDSKLFEIGLTADEIVATILFEISSMINSYEAIDQVRVMIDLYLLSEDDVINIRNSANYSQLIIYALKDTLYKVSSIMFKEDPEEIQTNRLIQVLELEDSLLPAQEKILSSPYGSGECVREPKITILQWMFMIYKDIKHNSSIIKETLTEAKYFTASRLIKSEIDKTLAAVDRINVTIFESCSLNRMFEAKAIHSLNEISIFKSLKQNGLRGIEDALYEYALRIKNCETEEDALYILRGINTRLSILEDYLNNTPDLSDTERKRWELVATKYRELREQLAKKKIVNKKQYGLFFDYDQLDQLDNNKNTANTGYGLYPY